MSILCGLAVFAALSGTNPLPPDTLVYRHGASEPFCVARDGISFCFAPGTSMEYVRKVLEHLPPRPTGGRQPRYVIGSRWTNPVSGFTGNQGDPVQLTYSFVPDGTALPNAASEPASNSDLYSKFNSAFASAGGEATWKAKIRAAITQWSNFGAITYTEVSDDGASLPGSFGSNTTPVRGDVRVSGHPIDGQAGILAYNYFPDYGDMVIDTADTAYFTITDNDYRFLRNTVGHEHGHGLGFNHVIPTDNTKLMEPFLNTNFDGPQDDDIRAVQRNYGDRFENNDTAATATDFGAIGSLTTYSNLSTDSATDVDWFKFMVASDATLAVRTLPVGATYPVGPQGGSTATVNTLTVNKISFDVYAADGTTLLARRNSAAIGTQEALSNLSLSGAGGSIYIKVYNSGSVQDDIQRYNLEVNINQNVRVFSGTLDLQGSVNKAQPITFDFRLNGVSQFTRTVTLDANGAFTLNNILANNYTVGIKGAKWLRKTVNINVTASDYTGFAAQLRGGDANNNNIVDVNDLTALIAAYNKVSPAPGYSAAADFTCDGKDDIDDLLVLISNYNQTGDN